MRTNDRGISARDSAAARPVVDLSSSPPDTGYQSDPDLPRRSPVTERVPFDLNGPVHSSDTEVDFIRTTGDIPSSDSVDSEDDADPMLLYAASDTSVRGSDDFDLEDDEDELEETTPEQDEDMDSMDDDISDISEISEDGEINADDGDSSMSESQNDDGRLFKLSTWISC